MLPGIVVRNFTIQAGNFYNTRKFINTRKQEIEELNYHLIRLWWQFSATAVLCDIVFFRAWMLRQGYSKISWIQSNTLKVSLRYSKSGKRVVERVMQGPADLIITYVSSSSIHI